MMDETANGRLILWKLGSNPDIGYCAGSQEFANDVLALMKEANQLRAENEKLKADAKYGWQAQELILKNQALAAALVAKDEALVSIREYWNRDHNERAMADACEYAIETASDALDIKPHAALVAKLKAEAVREFGFGKAISHYANAHADSIERGEE